MFRGVERLSGMNLTQTQDTTPTAAEAPTETLVRECFVRPTPHAMDSHSDSPKVRTMYAETMAAFPDATMRPLWRVLDEDRLVLGGVVTATHRGPWRDVPATGRRIQVLTTIMLELSDGRVVDMMVVTDSLALAEQLGVVEPLGPKVCEPTRAARTNQVARTTRPDPTPRASCIEAMFWPPPLTDR